MEEGVVLEVNGLLKEFETGKSGSSHDKYIALNGISFDLKRGEILGIVGPNGSGKSTLLKILSKIYSPTSGCIEYDGRIRSIIDVGTGFHPDLTGKENIHLACSLLGHDNEYVNRKYNEIVDFSGVGDFIHSPVKHYSSGMYLRLAFAIAFNTEIEILLLDEVIAVGDAEFRAKCYDKIREITNNSASVIMVTHGMDTILEFCDRCIHLEKGEIKSIGKPMDVVESYLAEKLIEPDLTSNLSVFHEVFEKTKLRFNEFYIKAVSKQVGDTISMADDVMIYTSFIQEGKECSIEIIYYLSHIDGTRILLDSYGLRSNYVQPSLQRSEYELTCILPKNLLNRGVYTVGMMIGKNKKMIFDVSRLSSFKISQEESTPWGKEVSTLIRPHLNWMLINKSRDEEVQLENK